MKIDGIRIVPGTARVFPAIGGGWAMKMRIHRKAKCGDGAEFLFGRVADFAAAAREICRYVNIAFADGDYDVDSAEMERRWTEMPELTAAAAPVLG